MVQSINQFKQGMEQGVVTLLGGASNVIAGRVSVNQATPLVAGQPVMLEDSAGGVPSFVALSGNSDVPFGFVVKNTKDGNYKTGAAVEIAISGTFMYMTSGAAIARGAKIEVVSSANKVITNAGSNPVSGYCFDKATGSDQIVRVLIIAQSYQTSENISDISGLQTALDESLKTARVTATLAEINAGKEIVPAKAGKKIRVVDYTARVVGTFADNTSVDLRSGTSSTKVTVLGVAGLGDGNILQPSSANTNLGLGFAADLESGENLKALNIGSAATGGTSITFTVTYAYV
ncbi:MAG: DUF2190 family protein [Rickettsiales bacterium]